MRLVGTQRRPTTFRTSATINSWIRWGEGPFDSAARTHLVRTRRAGGLLNINDVQRGRNATTGGDGPPISLPPNRLLVRPLPGKNRRLTPVLGRFGRQLVPLS